MLFGYKSFLKGLKGMNNFQYEIGKSYTTNGPILARSNKGNGFFMCEDLEDTLRYYPELPVEDPEICLVRGSGKFDVDYDAYYDYTSFAFERIDILKLLTREDIIAYGIELTNHRLIKFISTLKLREDELKLFEEKFSSNDDVMRTLECCQKQKKKVLKNEGSKI